jgi:hypothetical protein
MHLLTFGLRLSLYALAFALPRSIFTTTTCLEYRTKMGMLAQSPSTPLAPAVLSRLAAIFPPVSAAVITTSAAGDEYSVGTTATARSSNGLSSV